MVINALKITQWVSSRESGLRKANWDWMDSKCLKLEGPLVGAWILRWSQEDGGSQCLKQREQHGQRPWVRKEFCHVGGTEQSQEELQHNTGEHLWCTWHISKYLIYNIHIIPTQFYESLWLFAFRIAETEFQRDCPNFQGTHQMIDRAMIWTQALW